MAHQGNAPLPMESEGKVTKTPGQLRDEAAELRKLAAQFNDASALAQIHALIEELERLAREMENGSGLASAAASAGLSNSASPG